LNCALSICAQLQLNAPRAFRGVKVTVLRLLFSNYTVKMTGEEKVQFVIKVTLNRSCGHVRSKISGFCRAENSWLAPLVAPRLEAWRA
jgi:hypothetical protein